MKSTSHPYRIVQGRLLPVNSNAGFNGYLKEIAVIEGLAVTGKVVDAKGSALQSALVVLKSDASYHTRSDKNGKYVLHFPLTKKDTLLYLICRLSK